MKLKVLQPVEIEIESIRLQLAVRYGDYVRLEIGHDGVIKNWPKHPNECHELGFNYPILRIFSPRLDAPDLGFLVYGVGRRN